MKKIEAIVPFSPMRATFDALEDMGVNFTYFDSRGEVKSQLKR